MADLLVQNDEAVTKGFQNLGDNSYAQVVVAVTDQVKIIQASITSGASMTGDIDLGNYRLDRITLPATWTAADLTFQVSDDGSTWYNLYDMYGSEYKVTGSTGNRSIIASPADFISIRYIHIRSGTSATPVNQASTVSLNIVAVR